MKPGHLTVSEPQAGHLLSDLSSVGRFRVFLVFFIFTNKNPHGTVIRLYNTTSIICQAQCSRTEDSACHMVSLTKRG